MKALEARKITDSIKSPFLKDIFDDIKFISKQGGDSLTVVSYPTYIIDKLEELGYELNANETNLLIISW